MVIAKISAGKAKEYYYEKDPLFNKEGANNNLTWFGKQAEMLGLEAQVSKEQFENLLNGKSADGETTLRDTNNATGSSVSCYDMVFASNKSVSLLALNGDERLIEAHDKAVTKALEYAEKNFANTQEGANRDDVNHGNILVARANHSVARATKEDPTPNAHLHTHAVLFNQVYNAETQKFKALSAQELFKNQSTLNAIYKSELAKEIVTLGYQLEDKKHGFDIKMPQEVIDKFSSRSKEIEAQTAGMSKKEEMITKHKLKSDKVDFTEQELRENWNKKLNEVGYASFADLRESALGKTDFYFKDAKEAIEKGASLLSENESTFTKKELLNISSKISLGQFSYSDLEKELDQVKKIGQTENYEVKSLGENEKGEKTYTTKEIHDIERENIKLVQNHTSKALMSQKDATEALRDFESKNFKLTEGQFESAKTILSSNDGTLVIQGYAGSGKTTMLQALNHSLEYHNSKVEVTLLSSTHRASQGAKKESTLQSGKSFEAKTTTKFILDSKQANAHSETSGKQIDAQKYVTSGKDALKVATISLKDNSNTSTSRQTKLNDGAIRKEKLSSKNGETTYKSETTFKDGSQYSFQSKESNTNSIKAKFGIKQNYSEAKNADMSQTNSSISFAKIASIEESRITTKEKNSNSIKKSILGFSSKITNEEIKDDRGNIIASKTTKEFSFMDKSLKTEILAQTSKDEPKNNDVRIQNSSFDYTTKESKESQINATLSKEETQKIRSDTSKTNKMLIIDESSMLSSKDVNAIMKHAKENNIKIIFMGDSKQLQAISAGKGLEQVSSNSNVIEMKEILRQQNPSEKEIAHNARDTQTLERTFKELHRSNKIHEIKDEATRLNAVADSAVKIEILSGTNHNGTFSKQIDYTSNLILTSRKDDVAKLNELVRDKLHESGQINKNDGIEMRVKVPINMSPSNQVIADNYAIGQKVSTFQNVKGMDKGKEYEILKLNRNTNELMLKHTSSNGKDQFRKVNLKDAAGKLSITKDETKNFTKGDIVVITITDKKEKLLNSDRGIVIGVDKEKSMMKVDFGNGNIKELDATKQHGLNHGFSGTNCSSQGVSIERTQTHVNTEKGTNLNDFHVQQTRQKLKSEVFTDDVVELKTQVTKEQTKTSTLQYDSVEPKIQKVENTSNEKIAQKESVKAVDAGRSI
ncbi:MAG: relaxase domain-containing protein [Campylobacterales bacterium]|nr:relaxase domain-containing protein [Campylobacterales bacterium]